MAHVPYSRVLLRDVDWDAVLDGKSEASCYYMRSGLIRKDLLPAYAGDDGPQTFILPDVPDSVRDGNPDAPWVLKKAAGSNASGTRVILSRDVGELVEALAAAAGENATSVMTGSSGARRVPPKWILQRYVLPATVDDRKFHIRVPVLAVGALSVFVHTNCRVISASEPWTPGHWSDTFPHITNLNVNCNHPSYSEWDQNFILWALQEPASRHMWLQMCRITASLFTRVFPMKRHFLALPNCYELFGLDFAVSEEGRVLLLEVNPDPGLSMFHVHPPSGALEVGSKTLVLNTDGSCSLECRPGDDDATCVMGATLPCMPPPGHDSLPLVDDPLRASDDVMAAAGFMKVLTLP